MREQKKANRVSWASGANLCQVRYFQSADHPSKIGQETHDHPQVQVSHSYHVVSDGGYANVNSPIPQVRWKTPPEFVLRSYWLVAAGQESEEIKVQKHREARVLEAVYPYLTAIPPIPLISLDVEGEYYDDTHTPVIPIIPIEETTAMELSSLEAAPPNFSIDSPPANLLQGPTASATLNIPPYKSALSPEPSNHGKSALVISHGLEGDPMVATAAAENAILKTKEPSLIDPDLLVKLLKDPEITQKLINEHRLKSITGTGTSGSKVFGPAVPLPSSQLPIDKSNNENSRPTNAGTEAIRRPLTIKLSSSAHSKTGTASGPKLIQPPVSLLRSTNDLLIKSSIHENNQPAKGGNIAATQTSEQLLAANTRTETGSRPNHVTPSFSLTSSTCDLPSEKSTSRCQPPSTRSQTKATPVKQFLAANTETGTGSQSKQAASSVSLSSSARDLPSEKPTSEHGHRDNIGSVATRKPVTHEIRAGSAPKTGTPSLSLPISIHDLPSKKSTREHNQQANTGTVVVPKPVVTQSVAANTGIGSGFRIKTGTRAVSLPISIYELPGKKSTSEYYQQANIGNVVAPKSEMTQSIAANTGIGMGFKIKTVNSPVSLPTPRPEILSKKSSNEHGQLARTENVGVPRPLMQSLAANATIGTGFRPMAVTPSVPFPSSIPDFWMKNPSSEPRQLANAVAGLVPENQPLSISRINAELLGTPANFGSLPVAKQIHLIGPNLDISRLKKLIDEHGAHVQGGNAPVAGINPLFPNPSKPDVEMLKKMVSDYGLHHGLENPLAGSEPVLVPVAVTTSGALVPFRENSQLLPAAFSTSPYSAPTTLLLKDMQYYQSLIKQHGEKQRNGDRELLQQNKPQNYLQESEATQSARGMEFEPKFQKPCLYFNTPKGCRNGSRCRFQHDLSKPWRSGGVLEAPSGKRMKPDGELTGKS